MTAHKPAWGGVFVCVLGGGGIRLEIKLAPRVGKTSLDVVSLALTVKRAIRSFSLGTVCEGRACKPLHPRRCSSAATGGDPRDSPGCSWEMPTTKYG